MESSESIHNITQHASRRGFLNQNVAIRLYNSVSMTNTPVEPMESLMSVCSSNELGHSCRICRWNRSDLPIQQCPCECRGSVGYVHLMCLRRWILHRGDNLCEICGTRFILEPEKRSFKTLFCSFFQSKYIGAILRNCAHLLSLAPISYVVLYQMLQILDNLEIGEHNTLQIVVFAPALLMTSSIIFFHILEFSIARCLIIKNIFKHWWNFGGQSSDPGLDLEVPSEFFDFF